MIAISDEIRKIIDQRRERRQHQFLAMLRRFARERPNENARRLIADEKGISYKLVCDVLTGRR